MLNLDINHLTPAELEEAVYYFCSQCGTVKNIRFHSLTERGEREVAAVEMASAEETDKLVYYNIGDLKFGDTAIIRLSAGEPEPEYLGHDSRLWSSKGDDGENRIEILLIEDDPRVIHSTRGALKASGIPHNLNSVADGLDAMLFMHRGRRVHDVPVPDIVLVVKLDSRDVEDEVLSEIRTCETLFNIPVVVMLDLKAETIARLLSGGAVTKRPAGEGVVRMRKTDVLAPPHRAPMARIVPFVERRAFAR